jgi:hypothetical protein
MSPSVPSPFRGAGVRVADVVHEDRYLRRYGADAFRVIARGAPNSDP